MTSWQPELSESGPRYLAIADALAEDLAAGKLPAGTRLPTHRDLAWRLGVTVGTVTRAYAEAERRGLVQGEVGRGTYVRTQSRISQDPVVRTDLREDFVDLSMNLPPPLPDLTPIREAVKAVAEDPELGRWLAYTPPLGLPEHRAAGAAWLKRSGLEARAEEVVPVNGTQHGMMLALTALLRPGATLLTEELTFYGIKAVARLFDYRFQGVEMDEEGLLPEALEAACRNSGARVLYCMPLLQNPTCASFSPDRSHAIAEVCRRNDLWVIEDDIYGFLAEGKAPPLARLLPERTVYLTAFSKSVAPGLRAGWLKLPSALLDRVALAQRASATMSNPLMHETARRLIASGAAEHLAEIQLQECRARQEMAARHLAGQEVRAHPSGFHLWLTLPQGWRAESFAAEARRRGVGVATAEVFAVGRRPPPQAVRVSISAAPSRPALERALQSLTEILAAGTHSAAPLV